MLFIIFALSIAIFVSKIKCFPPASLLSRPGSMRHFFILKIEINAEETRFDITDDRQIRQKHCRTFQEQLPGLWNGNIAGKSDNRWKSYWTDPVFNSTFPNVARTAISTKLNFRYFRPPLSRYNKNILLFS